MEMDYGCISKSIYHLAANLKRIGYCMILDKAFAGG
jgi:hypothetical protein